MEVLHISAECYPAAKAGGLADVVGTLPKYLTASGSRSAVIIPKYHTPWILQQELEFDHAGVINLGKLTIPFAIEKVIGDPLGFPLYLANIPGKFDRLGIYADPGGWYYPDDVERFLCFQQAALNWVLSLKKRPKLLHCHDHHTGLVPFMVQFAKDFELLKNIPTVFTIHNAEYDGAFGWERENLLPVFEEQARGILDWNQRINPLITGIKTAWRITTVSPNYMEELKLQDGGLGWLLRHESEKTTGVLNGIDVDVWDPATDPFLTYRFEEDVTDFKAASKGVLYQRFNLQRELPILTFIGRLVREKGGDLLPDLFSRLLHAGLPMNYLVLGTGEPQLHEAFQSLAYHHPGYFDCALEYNEGLAHQLYAGSDFLIMPSRVEPCGLNQMYAMRYGTIPVVRSVGGLKDSVPDLAEDPDGGLGIRFDEFSLESAEVALRRASDLFQDKDRLQSVRERVMKADYSWERSAVAYAQLYNDLFDLIKM